MDKDAGRVRKLRQVNVGAVLGGVAAVVNVEFVVNVAHVDHPVPRLVGPRGVCSIVRVASQAGGRVEQDAVRDGVLIVIAVIGWRDLPPKAATALAHVPARGLRVEDALRQHEPLRFVGRRVWERGLGGEHGRHAPEALVVVAEGGGPIGRHEVVGRRVGLEGEGVLRLAVVRRVARVVPVVDHGPPHGPSLPPVVRACWRWPGEDAGCLSWLVAVVVCKEVGSDELGGGFDGF